MTDSGEQFEDWLTPAEREVHDTYMYNYLRQHAPQLFRVGVTLAPEQEARIRAFVEQDRLVDAQKLILDELARQFEGGH